LHRTVVDMYILYHDLLLIDWKIYIDDDDLYYDIDHNVFLQMMGENFVHILHRQYNDLINHMNVFHLR